MAMPMGLIRAAVTMLPRLDAEERLHAAEIAAVGAGVTAPETARQVYAGLRAAAQGTAGPVRPRPAPAGPVELQIFGIGVEERPPRGC